MRVTSVSLSSFRSLLSPRRRFSSSVRVEVWVAVAVAAGAGADAGADMAAASRLDGSPVRLGGPLISMS